MIKLIKKFNEETAKLPFYEEKKEAIPSKGVKKAFTLDPMEKITEVTYVEPQDSQDDSEEQMEDQGGPKGYNDICLMVWGTIEYHIVRDVIDVVRNDR